MKDRLFTEVNNIRELDKVSSTNMSILYIFRL